MRFVEPAHRPKKRGHPACEDPLEALLNSVKRVCHSALDSISLRRRVAELVAPRLAFDSYAFSTCDPDTGLMTHVVADGVPPRYAMTYVTALYPEHCAQIAMDQPRRGVHVFSMLEESPVVREAVLANGMREQVQVSVATTDRLWGTWCLMRASRRTAKDERSRSLLRQLVPHLARGLRAAALIDIGLASTTTHGSNAAGVLVLDARDRPVLRTPLAATWLRDLSDIGLRMPDDLPLAIIGLVTRLRSRRVEVAPALRMRARGQSGRLYTLRGSLAEPDAAGECASVVVIQPAAPREVASLLTLLYDLSAREREVVAAVARGEATKTIAASLGISPHTVVEHVDRACEKIGVRGRKALIAKLFFAGYAPFLADGR